MRVTKIDLACTNPAAVAAFLAAVFKLEKKMLGEEWFAFDLEGLAISLCTKQMAGVDESAQGTQQVHLEGSEDPAAVAVRAAALGAKTEQVDYASGICIWDPEGNPWIITRRKA